MASPFDLIINKQYDAAIVEYTRLYEVDGDTFHLGGRALGYMLTRDYASALDDYQSIIRTFTSNISNLSNDSAYIYAGICFWCLNRPEEALPTWREGLGAVYKDAAGGVELPAVLLYAGCRLKDAALQKEALQLLKKHWQKHVRRQKRRQAREEPKRPTHDDLVYQGLYGWPGVIVPYLLGIVDEACLLHTVQSAGHETLKKRYQCAADFYIALSAALNDDMVAFEVSMKRSAAGERGELEHESYLARWEVDQGFPQPASP